MCVETLPEVLFVTFQSKQNLAVRKKQLDVVLTCFAWSANDKNVQWYKDHNS